MRVLLTPVADRPESAKALNAAFDLGHRIGASVRGVHVRPHRSSGITLSAEFAEAAWRKKSTKKAPTDAKTLFTEIAEQRGFDLLRRARATPGAIWNERVGAPNKIMAIEGPVADLIVVSRPAKKGSVADMFLRAAIFESGRPVLLLPPAGRRNVGQRVLIAWNQSAEASVATAAAMPILQAAESVTIVSCGPEDMPGPKSQQMANYLLHYGVKAERVNTKGRDIEKELLGVAKDVKADLMISGAYSKSRWRESMFGGTTDFLAYEARLPVMMLHR